MLQNRLSLRALIKQELAFQSALAMGRCAPNPPVACVGLVWENSIYQHIIGGATEKPGKRHAEIVCLDRYQDLVAHHRQSPHTNTRPSGLTTSIRLYVSLEPCNHHGRTPPCTERILQENSIDRILAWQKDPLLKHSGIAWLKENKQKASFISNKAVYSNEATSSLAQTFLSGFLNRVSGQGPRLHLKVACSQDGMMGLKNSRIHLSQAAGLAFGHLLRAKLDAVVVGMGTILSDQPHLDLRAHTLEAGLATLEESYKKSPISIHNQSYSKPSQIMLCQSWLSQAVHLGTVICQQNHDYQPDRIFIVGRYPDPNNQKILIQWQKFLERQKQVAKRSQKEAIFLVEEPHASTWQTAMPGLDFHARVPPLQSPDFGKVLRNSILSKRGYNEVLIEGGAKLFSALESELNPQDCIYTLRSKKTTQQILAKQVREQTQNVVIRTPIFLEKNPPIASYDLGMDTIELRMPS